MPPTLKKLRGNTGLGTNRLLEIGFLNFLFGISMKIKRTRIFFFSVGLAIAEFPFSTFFRLSHCRPMEPCEQNILRIT